MTPYRLPDLEYDYGALEPYISGRIMELHHSKHHAAYVKQANETLAKLEEARVSADVGTRLTRLSALEHALAFNLSGHILHSVFWKNLSAQSSDKPTGELATAIDRDFGSFAQFRKQMNGVAAGVMGSGWAALTWEPIGSRLLITQIYDHQSNLNQAGVPLMLIDAWEHAYYLQYHNEKTRYFDAIWNLWNWKDIAARLNAARHLDLALAG